VTVFATTAEDADVAEVEQQLRGLAEKWGLEQKDVDTLIRSFNLKVVDVWRERVAAFDRATAPVVVDPALPR